MAYSEALAQRLRGALSGYDLSERKMFGGIAFMWRGNMLCGVIGERLMARVGAEGLAPALMRPGASPMDFTGRPMKGFVYVDQAVLARDSDLEEWLRTCEAFVSTLPPK